jgi:hypothetical protein
LNNYGVAGDLREIRQGTSQQVGDYLEIIEEGTRDYIQSKYAIARAGVRNGTFNEATVSHRGSLYTLTTRIAQSSDGVPDTTPQITLRGDNNRVQKSIFEPPVPGNPTSEEIGLVQKALETRLPADLLAMVDAAAAANLEGRPNAAAAINALYDLGNAKVEFRIVNQRVLTVVRNAPLRYQWPNRDAWVDHNLSHGQMIDDSDISGVLNFTLPTILEPVTWNGLLMFYGWLKHEPIYDTAGGERSTESLTYEFGLWPLFLVPVAV